MDYLSLCLICKDENEYLPEWLDYHILMGVDRFYIYDNESRTSLRESLRDYIERGWVLVVDIGGRARQLYAYDHCLQSFGGNTVWMGFVDTDEFLVPKNALGLKELLKEYEGYGGVAVSSLFFGSNGHRARPSVGQIAAYTTCVHESFNEYEYIKSIVQPSRVLVPNSPHDFIYKDASYCVNENFIRVDGQHFPVSTKRIQLNHYYCRSEEEIERKLQRGRGALNASWPRRRFDMINLLATHEETSILHNLENTFQQAGINSNGLPLEPGMSHLLENIAVLAKVRPSPAFEAIVPPEGFTIRDEFAKIAALREEIQAALGRNDFLAAKNLMTARLQMLPQLIPLYADLANCLLDLGDPESAWQVLGLAWQVSPNNYVLLGAMTFYFLRIKNFKMAENTCRLLLEMAPHDLIGLGMLTHSLLGQERFEEALRIGAPVVEISAKVGELPGRMGVFLVKKMADYLTEKKDYEGALFLWENGVKCQPNDAGTLVEYSRALLVLGNKKIAQQSLLQAQALDPQNEAVKNLLKQISEADLPRRQRE